MTTTAPPTTGAGVMPLERTLSFDQSIDPNNAATLPKGLKRTAQYLEDYVTATSHTLVSKQYGADSELVQVIDPQAIATFVTNQSMFGVELGTRAHYAQGWAWQNNGVTLLPSSSTLAVVDVNTGCYFPVSAAALVRQLNILSGGKQKVVNAHFDRLIKWLHDLRNAAEAHTPNELDAELAS